MHIFLHHFGSFRLQTDNRASQCEVHGIQKRVRLEITLYIFRGKTSKINVQVSFDVVYLEDTSGG